MVSFYFMGDMGDGSTNQFNVSKAIERKMRCLMRLLYESKPLPHCSRDS